MPTKKKVQSHPKKKTLASTKPVTIPKEESVSPSPENDRPVMQVVQIPENESLPEGSPATLKEEPAGKVPSVSTEKEEAEPTEPVVSPQTPQEASVVSSHPAEQVAPVPEKTVPVENPLPAESNVISAPVTQTAASVPSSSETFSEELPPVKSSKKGLIIFLIVVLLLVCGAVGGYIYLKGGVSLSSVSSLLNMRKTAPEHTTSLTPTAAPTAVPTPASVNKSKYTIEVLNGSGVPGEAAKVKSALTTAGYTVSSTGNAATTDYTQTEISAKASVDSAFITALRTDLSKTYQVSSNVVALPAQASVDIILTIGSQIAQ